VSELLLRLGEFLPESWQLAIGRYSGFGHTGPRETGADWLFLRARAMARAGDLKMAARLFADAAALAPTFTGALEGHGEILDMEGDNDLAMAKYDEVRRLRAQLRNGAPDRTFVLRRRGRFTPEIAAYTSVLHSVKRRALPYIARGNAYLAEGRPELALVDYETALRQRPNLPEVAALKAEALAMMGRYAEALGAFDKALAGLPDDAEILSGRAITRLALGRLEAADADWRRQLALLLPERASARACVALRLTDYAAALPELDRALAREPGDPYWRLYRQTALSRLGRPIEPLAAGPLEGGDDWPGPLLALQAGRLSADEVLKRADNDGRRAEALFQLGVIACVSDAARARQHWQEVADRAVPSLIEHAMARHELARPGP
jgi:tetratricopeptide (TPR) repeat protein